MIRFYLLMCVKTLNLGHLLREQETDLNCIPAPPWTSWETWYISPALNITFFCLFNLIPTEFLVIVWFSLCGFRWDSCGYRHLLWVWCHNCKGQWQKVKGEYRELLRNSAWRTRATEKASKNMMLEMNSNGWIRAKRGIRKGDSELRDIGMKAENCSAFSEISKNYS